MIHDLRPLSRFDILTKGFFTKMWPTFRLSSGAPLRTLFRQCGALALTDVDHHTTGTSRGHSGGR